MRGAVLFVGGVAVCLAVYTYALDLAFQEVGQVKDLMGIVQASVTALAIAAGGVFAGAKLQVFREFEAHLTITHEVSHRSIGDNYIHVAVTVTLRNSSKVAVEVRNGFSRLQQVIPVSDEDVEFLYAQAFVHKEEDYIQWPTLEEIPRAWDKGILLVEPGEAHQVPFEFIVSVDVRSVIIYTYFNNQRFSQASSRPSGWDATTFYDLVNPS